jgi:hypothetical protein
MRKKIINESVKEKELRLKRQKKLADWNYVNNMCAHNDIAEGYTNDDDPLHDKNGRDGFRY